MHGDLSLPEYEQIVQVIGANPSIPRIMLVPILTEAVARSFTCREARRIFPRVAR